MKSIFKEEAKLEVKIIDMNDPKVKEEIEEIKKEQQKILDRKYVDPESLRLVINI